MSSRQGDVALLDTPVAQELLQSRNLAQLAYVWPDGTPRVVPIWFQWSGREMVVASPPDAPKLKALSDGARVAVSISTNQFPDHVVLLRGPVTVQPATGIVPEYAAAAERYLGSEAARGWMEQVGQLGMRQMRIAVTPDWVGLLDFETRWPSAVERAMERGSSPP